MVDGRDGRPGQTGSDGAIGAEGAAGRTGDTGATGAAGFVGADGADGADGRTGDAGARGSAGVQGVVGEQGAVGLSGPAGQINITTKQRIPVITSIAVASLVLLLALLAWTSIVANSNSAETRRVSAKLDRQVDYLQRIAVDNHDLLQQVTDLTGKVDCATQRTVQRIVDQLVPTHPNVITPVCQLLPPNTN